METQRLRKSGYTLLGMTRYVLYTALAILSLSSMNYETALDWLQSSRRRGTKLTRGTSRDALRRVLEEIVLRSSAADIVNTDSLCIVEHIMHSMRCILHTAPL